MSLNKGKFVNAIKKVVLVNSFLEINQYMRETIEQSLHVLRNCPQENLQLPYNFYSIIQN